MQELMYDQRQYNRQKLSYVYLLLWRSKWSRLFLHTFVFDPPTPNRIEATPNRVEASKKA